MAETFQIFTVKFQKSKWTQVVFSAVVASVGGVLFGYDIGIISGAILQLKDEFELTSFKQEMVVSSVLMGAFIASFFGGNIVDTWGRKFGIALSCFLFISGALVLALSVNFPMLLIGRLVVGAAVSLSVTSECTYISEISPPKHRGMMVSLNEVGITIGFLLAYLMSYMLITTQNGWRYMFGAASALALVQALGIIWMPNSHIYLLLKGQTEKARIALQNLRSNDNVEEEMNAIKLSMEEQKNYRYCDLFSSISNMRGRMVIGIGLVIFQQFSGNANILYYAPTVFEQFGYSSDTVALLVSVGLGIVKVLSTVVVLVFVDKVGRRSLLLIGCILMATSMLLLGIVIIRHPVTNEMTKILSAVSLMVFVCAYGISYGPVTWLLLSEIFPGSLRGRAVSVATSLNWGSNIIVSLTFLDIIKSIGIGTTFIAYGLISYGAAVFIFLWVPETKNKTLEEIDGILTKGYFHVNFKNLLAFNNKD